MNIEKLEKDLKLTKARLITFWFVFGFAVISFIFSALNFSNNLTASEKLETQNKKNKNLEIELSKLKTSIFKLKNKESLSLLKSDVILGENELK